MDRIRMLHAMQRPIMKRLRRQRMIEFSEWAALSPATRVLDVGGTVLNWEILATEPDLTIVNLAPTESGRREVVADATSLPFRSRSFDISFSNSVVEHVTDHVAFASELQRVGRRYFVQTPNRKFPFEPHVMTPLVNYLPKRLQRRTYRNFTLWGWITRPSREYVDQFVAETNLLDRRELQALFPRASIKGRRSLIATSPRT